MHLPSCTTYVTFTQLQPGKQIKGHLGLGFEHDPSHPLHSENSWPSIGHSVRSRKMWEDKNSQKIAFPHKTSYMWMCKQQSLYTLWIWTTLTRFLGAFIYRSAFVLVNHSTNRTATARSTDSKARNNWFLTRSITSFAHGELLAFNWTSCVVWKYVIRIARSRQ